MRRILRKILGPVREGMEYRRRQLYKHTEKIADVMRKRAIAFYGHITRMDLNRLVRRILTYFQGRKIKS